MSMPEPTSPDQQSAEISSNRALSVVSVTVLPPALAETAQLATDCVQLKAIPFAGSKVAERPAEAEKAREMPDRPVSLAAVTATRRW